MDIYFRHENKCFNFRVSAVINKESKILLSHINDTYTLPGGRVKFGETTEKAIKRAILEEFNVKAEVIKLLSINENFFEYGDDDYHELLFVYSCEINEEIDINEVNNNELMDDIYEFVSINEIMNLNLKPEFLLTELKKLSNYINK